GAKHAMNMRLPSSTQPRGAMYCSHHTAALLSLLLWLPWSMIGCGDGGERSEARNTAPQPVAAVITTAQQTRGTTQVQPGDPDVGQSHTFAITTPPAHGISSVDATGLVTYAPQATFT